MRKGRPRYPQPKDIALVWGAINKFIPMDVPPEYGYRESLKLNPAFRIKSTTNEKNWTVDIYSGQFYVVTVGDRLAETCKSIPSLVGYLCRMLGTKPVI